MSKGMVTTARGDILNMDALIDEAKRPYKIKVDKSEVSSKKRNKSTINVKGYKPGTGQAKPINVAQNKETVEPEVVISTPDKNEATIEDYTHIKIKANKSTNNIDLVANEILSELGKYPGTKEDQNPQKKRK